MNNSFDINLDDNKTLTIISHNCQMNKEAQRLSLLDNEMGITCMQEPLDVVANPKFGYSYNSEQVISQEKDWQVFGIFTEFIEPFKLKLLNVHLNPNPWPEPGLQRRIDLENVIDEKTPHIVMGDFNEVRNGPCDQMLYRNGYVELSNNIKEATWFSIKENQNIDRIYCKKSLLKFINFECRIGDRYNSDHAQVLCSISLNDVY